MGDLGEQACCRQPAQLGTASHSGEQPGKEPFRCAPGRVQALLLIVRCGWRNISAFSFFLLVLLLYSAASSSSAGLASATNTCSREVCDSEYSSMPKPSRSRSSPANSEGRSALPVSACSTHSQVRAQKTCSLRPCTQQQAAVSGGEAQPSGSAASAETWIHDALQQHTERACWGIWKTSCRGPCCVKCAPGWLRPTQSRRGCAASSLFSRASSVYLQRDGCGASQLT